jgi:hypothetical protein
MTASETIDRTRPTDEVSGSSRLTNAIEASIPMFGYSDEAAQRAVAAARQFERKGDTVSARRAREFVDELTGVRRRADDGASRTSSGDVLSDQST